jgi:uncharacterized protein (UPF0212 family)
MIGKLVTQLTALLTISILFGLYLKHFNVSLAYSIPLGIMMQFGLYYIFIMVLDAWVVLKNKKLENERIKEFSLQGMEVSCPCSLKKVEFVPIILNTNNNYKCNHCQKNISVYVTAETALVTEPLIMPQVPNIPTAIG